MRLLRLLAAALVAAAPVAAPAAAQTPADSGRFESEIAAFERRDRESPPEPGGVLFVGSSSIRMWCMLGQDFPALRPLNRGFGGSRMDDLLHYAERVVLPYRPRLVVVYEGDNDLAAGRTPAQVHETFRRFSALVRERLPETRVVYVAVKPSPARAQLTPSIRALNRLLRRDAAADPRVDFADVFTPMLRRDGRPRPELFGADGLHMNSAGYAVWRAALAPVLATAAR